MSFSPTPPFIVMDAVARTWHFDTAQEVAEFMLGKRIDRWHVYKQIELRSADMNAIVRQLEGEDASR